MNQSAAYQYTDLLRSERLTTQFLTEADVKSWAGFFKDDDAIEFLPEFPDGNHKEHALFWINRQLNRYAARQYGLQALIDKKSGQLIGQCGLLLQNIDGTQELEVGYHIFKKYLGQGYAPEAAKLFIDFAFGHNLAPSLISIIDVGNYKSQRVAEKNGLVKEKQLNWNGLEIFIYRIYNHE